MEGKYVHVYIYIYKSGNKKVLIKSQKIVDKTQELRYTIIKIRKGSQHKIGQGKVK